MTATTTQNAQLPVYFDRMIAAFENGATGRHAHLGHWDTPTTGEFRGADDFAAAQQRMNARLIPLAQLQDGCHILDVGCGFGGLIQALDSVVTSADITGVNIDWRQLEICHRLQSHHGNCFRWQEADACELPFPAETFDTVFCVEAMFHFPSRKSFLAEVWRVLRPSGRLVATDFTLLGTASLPKFAVSALLNDGYGPWPDPWCINGSAAQLLKADGWGDSVHTDATANTLPSYQFVLPSHANFSHDPVDRAARSAMMLQWLHANHGLRYDYLSATKAEST